jgi:hypothetical protein
MAHSFLISPRSRRWLAVILAIGSVGALIPLSSEMARAAPRTADTPDTLIEGMNRALLPGRSMTAKALLTTTDPSGASSRIEFDFARLTDAEGVDRTLVEVTSPESEKGTAFLIISRPGKPLESWIWSPAVGRLRRIIGIHRTEAFLGTEFTYEDLGLAAPLERRSGEASEVVEDGEQRVLLDSGPYHYYGHVRTYLDRETGMPRRIVYFDRAGHRFREQRFLEVRQIGEHPFPKVIEVEDELTGTSSRLEFSHVKFDVDIPPTLYTESIIRQKLRRGGKLDVPTDFGGK